VIQVVLWLSITIDQASALGMASLNEQLAKQQIKQAVGSVIGVLKNNYIYPEKALLIENELSRKLALNEFDEISDWLSFIRHINVVMRSVSGDLYLDIVETKSSIILEKTRKRSTLDNAESHGIDNISILLGNVGYFKVSYFYQNPIGAREISRTLDSFSKVDALIIDLRDAEGDSIFFAQHLMSFFVKKIRY